MSRQTACNQSLGLPVIQPGKPASSAPKLKSGRGWLRACVLIAVHLLILLHITHYWLNGQSLSPVEPSEAMYTIELGLVNAGAIFFGLAIVSTAVFGRFFCGWGCHIVALQDLSGHLLRKIGIKPKPFRSRLLVFVPFALAFYMFLWPSVQRLWRGDHHPGFSNHLLTQNFWYTFPGPVVSGLTFVVCGGLIVYLLGNKGFCTYACPYGAFFSVADRLAVGRIRVTDACHQCGQCTAHCTSNVQVHAEVRDFGMVVDPGCMKCMDCVSICPNEALYFGLTARPDQAAPRSAAAQAGKPARGGKKNYDLSLPEEVAGAVVAAFAVFALRGLYDITPLLLSVGVGVITAFLAIQFVRIFRRRDLRIQNLQLKLNRRVTFAGWCSVVLLAAWFVLVIHSFLVQFHRHRGRDQLGRIAVTWPDLLSGTAQPLLTPVDHARIDRALASYRITDRIGLADVKEVKLGLAVGNLMKGDLAATEKYLREGYDLDPPAVREMIREFLVTQDRQAEAAEIR